MENTNTNGQSAFEEVTARNSIYEKACNVMYTAYEHRKKIAITAGVIVGVAAIAIGAKYAFGMRDVSSAVSGVSDTASTITDTTVTDA